MKIQNLNTDLKIGFRLEPHDLAASKLVAGREKDGPFVAALLRHGIVDRATLQARIELLPLPEARREQLQRWLASR